MSARRLSWQRGTAMLLAAGLAFVLVGDRARAGLIPGVGIDPLEVMDLQVKPNVIIVLDSSGSMTETPLGAQTTSGDHPRSKLGQAKTVLAQVIANNDKKASFLFGQYKSDAVQAAAAHNRGGDRWLYGADSLASPSMLTQEIVLDYHAFQEIKATNNTFVFGEETGASGSAEAICQFNVPVGFYTPGAGAGSMAQALQDGMNTLATCAPARTTANLYTVTWDATNRRFNYVDAGGGTHRYRIRWGSVAPVPSIRALITANVTATPGFTANAGTYNAGRVLRLTRRDATMKFNDTVVVDPGPPPVTVAGTFYNLISTRFWNGQTLHVLPPPSLDVCAITVGAPGDGTVANPWYFNIAVRNTCAGASGTPVKFTFFGDFASGNGISCKGFQQDVPLIPCDQTTPTQVSTISPFLQPQVAVSVGNSSPTCVGGTCPLVGYSEANDGTFDELTPAAVGGVSASGSTPVIQSIADVHGLANNLYDPAGSATGRPQRGFAELWFNGQAAAPGPPAVPAIPAIRTHPNPKERTILLFITDGDPTCSNVDVAAGAGDDLARGSAWSAEQAFKRLDPAEPASSLSTYFVAFGNGASVTRANWIAWGGSGYTSQMVASLNGGIGARSVPSNAVISATTPPAGPPPPDDYIKWAISPPDSSLCPTCIDTFIAPDAPTLIKQLEAILNQGASTGEFSAQQSVTSNVYEYGNLIPGVDALSGAPFDPANPTTRLVGFVPTRFVSTFSVPGFLGQFRAFTDVNGDGAVDGPGPNGERWSAGDKLLSLVTTGRDGLSGMSACTVSGTAGECTFLNLHANATDVTLAASAAAIKRRIYTTSGNGSFGVTAQNAINLTSPGRVAIWPPNPASATSVAPNSDTAPGLLDAPLGLPTGTLTAASFTALQTTFHACKGIGAGGIAVDAAGSGHPCSATNSAAIRAAKARREAREMLMAFTAGAKFTPDAAGDPKRLTTGVNAGEILYVARGWLLAEGTLSTPAVIAPPVADNSAEEPAKNQGFDDEYRVFRDGLRSAAPPLNPADAIGLGLGLRNPDRDSAAPVVGGLPAPDTRDNLKPVMTVVYVGTNLMLHAFRGGPCTNAASCTETGGEELWAFVPYDEVGKVTSRYINDPQPRNPHDFVIAASLRFGDIFVPIQAGDPDLVADVGGIDFNTACAAPRCEGVWRRILYVGRGFGGKYWTALDVTGPGRYTQDSLSANPPLVYWSRGNPDTVDGTPGGAPINGGGDLAAYATMGQTWSLPAINFVDKTGPSGVSFVLNMGSGYSTVAAEGHDFYTVDALTGNMIAHVDVDAAATSIGQGLPRASPPFPTTIVANAAGFSKARFFPGIAFHPASDFTTRNYFGDVQGRLWKVLVASPGTAVPVADIGTDQPLGSPLGLFGLLGGAGTFTAASSSADIANLKPAIFGSSGNDNRLPVDPDDPVPQFKNFSLFDNGTDVDTAPGTAATVGSGIKVFQPNTVFLFDRPFDVDSNFRGTLQPTTAALDKTGALGVPDGKPDGVVVFFGGTRFNPIGSPFVVDPCRSTFDSIVFAFNINTGGFAFDLQSADDTYTLFQDSRLVGIFTTYSPDTGSGGKLVLDEGLVKGTVQPPPPAGQPAGTTATNYSVIQTIRPNSPLPGVRFGSTVCQ